MVVTAQSKSLFGLSEMLLGSTPRDGGGLIFLDDEYKSTLSQYSELKDYFKYALAHEKY